MRIYKREVSGPRGAFICLLALASAGCTPRAWDGTVYTAPWLLSSLSRALLLHQVNSILQFLSTNLLNTSVLLWGDTRSPQGEIWGSTLTARDVICSQVPQVNVGLGSRNILVMQNTSLGTGKGWRHRKKKWKIMQEKKKKRRAEIRKSARLKCGSPLQRQGEKMSPSGSLWVAQEEET